MNTRAKPLSTAALAATTNANGGTTRATAATAASKAKNSEANPDPPAGKRKREALTELTALVTNNKGKAAKGVVKKEKFDGVVIKSKTTVAARKPLRVVGGTQPATQTATVVAKNDGGVLVQTQTVQVHDENAMAVDVPAQPALPSITVRRSLVPRATRISTGTRQSRGSVHSVHKADEEDPEANRVFKKPRTSSEAPEADPEDVEAARLLAEEEALAEKFAAELEAYANEPEADPDSSQWDDLDFDDHDDPLMVAEYVVEIFNYMKQVEVLFVYTLRFKTRLIATLRSY